MFDPWVRKIPWRRAWQPTPVSLPGESRGQRSLEGYSPQSCKDMPEVTERMQTCCADDGTLAQLWPVNWPVLALRPLEQAQKDNRVGLVLKTYRRMSRIQDCLGRVISRGSGLPDPCGWTGAGGDRTIRIRAQEKTPRRTPVRTFININNGCEAELLIWSCCKVFMGFGTSRFYL